MRVYLGIHVYMCAIACLLSVGERKIIPLIVEPWLKSTAVYFDRSKLIEDPIEYNDRVTKNNRKELKITEN